ncbi:hypothetical protein GWI33_013048 [Rhynchophorus ferrugineus]|uniref:Uncharacterized protein n=1 Tax=Rhynchophorus ferrugineus TaxID=354439 RepID=A0A834I5D1_RHYFE|nr:hypothetical protein GWI33_013048 [Rhynchophorus ferrugineus]
MTSGQSLVGPTTLAGFRIVAEENLPHRPSLPARQSSFTSWSERTRANLTFVRSFLSQSDAGSRQRAAATGANRKKFTFSTVSEPFLPTWCILFGPIAVVPGGVVTRGWTRTGFRPNDVGNAPAGFLAVAGGSPGPEQTVCGAQLSEELLLLQEDRAVYAIEPQGSSQIFTDHINIVSSFFL